MKMNDNVKFQEKFYSFVDTFYNDFPKPNKLIIPFILSLLIWIIIFSQEYLIATLLGVSIPYFSFILLFPTANLAGYIPFTIGGLGFREYTSILIFTTLYSISEEEIFLFTLLGFILLDILTGLFGFIASLFDRGKAETFIGFGVTRPLGRQLRVSASIAIVSSGIIGFTAKKQLS